VNPRTIALHLRAGYSGKFGPRCEIRVLLVWERLSPDQQPRIITTDWSSALFPAGDFFPDRCATLRGLAHVAIVSKMGHTCQELVD